MIEFIKLYYTWANEKFVHGTPRSNAKRLVMFSERLQQNANDNNVSSGHKLLLMGDCFLQLLEVGRKLGYTPQQLADFFELKIVVNKERNWKLNTVDNFYVS